MNSMRTVREVDLILGLLLLEQELADHHAAFRLFIYGLVIDCALYFPDLFLVLVELVHFFLCCRTFVGLGCFQD